MFLEMAQFIILCLGFLPPSAFFATAVQGNFCSVIWRCIIQMATHFVTENIRWIRHVKQQKLHFLSSNTPQIKLPRVLMQLFRKPITSLQAKEEHNLIW